MFPIGILISVHQIVTCWISDLLMNTTQQNKINDRIFNVNSTDVELNTDNTLQPDSADNTIIRDISVCNTNKKTDNKSVV